MVKILGYATRITSEKEYNLLKTHLNELIDEATVSGYLSELGADNEYTREISRLGKIGALYETEILRLPKRKSVVEEELFEFA